MRIVRSIRTALVLAIVAIAAMPARAQTPPVLAHDQILITGGGLQVTPSHRTVPRNIATQFSTAAVQPGTDGGQTPVQLPADALVVGELRGPALGAPVTVTARPGEPLKIQPLALSGLYFLENLRLVSGGATLLAATPSTVTLEVIDKVLVSQVSSRPLSADEIKKKGIVVDQTNFQVVNFTAAFGVKGQEIAIDFPMVVPSRTGIDLAPAAPAISLPSLQPTAAPAPFVNLPQLQEAFQSPNVGVSGLLLKVEDEDVEQSFNVPPLPALLVFPGRIAYLNQFFSVLTLVSNVAPGNSELTVHDVRAEIVLPTGVDGVVSNDDPLRMAKLGTPPVEQSKIQAVTQLGPDNQLGTADDIVTIAPQQSGNAEHLVEGLREGTHTVLVKISALLDLPIGPVKISGSAVGTIEVRNPTFALTLSHPATVTAGEEYDLLVTVTNTSESPANFVSVGLLPRSISGAKLLSQESVQIETIAAGDSQTVAFHLLSQRTGTVVATSFSSEGVPGKFELTHQVGALGIPLSPNTLVLSAAANGLPAEWRAVGTGFLGQGFALATSPVTPKGLLPMTQQIIYDRATELSEAGQRLTLGDSLAAVAEDLAFNWTGNNFTRIVERVPAGSVARTGQDYRAFDELLRQSNRGTAFMQLLAGALSNQRSAQGVAGFHAAWAEASASRPAHISAVTGSGSGPAPVVLGFTDPNGRRLGVSQPGGSVARQIPFAEFFTLVDAAPNFSQMGLISVPPAGAYSIDLAATAAGTFDLSLVVPEAASLRRIVYQNVAMQSGGRGHVHFTLGAAGNAYRLEIDETGDGTIDQTLDPSVTEAVVDGGPQLVSARQIVTGHADLSQFGQLIGLLFSEEISTASSQTGLEPAQLAHYAVDTNQVLGAALQPSGRVVLLSLRDGYGPFFSRNVTVTGIEDRLGHAMTPSSISLPIVADDEHLHEGGSVAGQVKRGDGTPVPGARIRFSQKAPVEVAQGELAGLGDTATEREVTVTVKDADSTGRYSFDYVRKFNISGAFSRFEAVDLQTGEHGSVATAIHHSGQHLDLDIILLGTGTLAGRAFAKDGTTPLAGAVVRVSSLTSFGETFSAVTDASGAFSIHGIPVGNVTVDAVHVATNANTLVASAIPNAGATVIQNLTLIPLAEIVTQTGALKGQVFHAAGMTPAPGIPVFTTLGGVATTDAAGGYRIEHLPLGPVTVRAIDQAAFEQGSIATTIVANTEITANIVLLGGTGTIHGVVVDSLGAKVQNALVGGGLALVRTDNNGEFTLQGVPLGQRTVTVLDEVRNLPGSATVNLTTPGETVGVQVVLQAKGTIAGRVFEADGQTPVAGLKVFLLGGANVSTVTDEFGAFHFVNVPIGPYTLSAFRPDFSDGNITQTKLVFQGEVRQANVVFRGKGKVVANLYNSTGNTLLAGRLGVFGLQVRTGILRPPDNLQCLGDVEVGDLKLELAKCETVGIGFGPAPGRITDTLTGTATFDGVFVGPFSVQGTNLIDGVAAASDTIVHAGDTVTVNLHLVGTSSAHGKVFETDGVTPVPREVIVKANPGDLTAVTCGGATVCAAGEQGQYDFPLVVPGQITLTATDAATGLQGQSVASVAAGGTVDVPIRLLGKGSVTVTVNGSNGLISGAQVTLRGANFPFEVRTGTTLADGKVTFSGGDSVTEGSFSVSAVAAGVSGFAGSSVAPNGHADVTITLPDEAGTVRGRFLRADAQTPVANAQIHLLSSREAFQTTGDDGSFQFDGVPKGAFTLEAFHPATARRGRSGGQIAVNHDEVTVDILELAQGSVTGFAHESRGQSAVANARVSLSSGSIFGGQFTTTTGPDGSYLFPAVSQGPFSVSATDPASGLSGTNTGSIAAEGEQAAVDIVIEIPEVGRIEGFVHDASGGVAAGAQVQLNNGSLTTVDNTGFYFFDSVPKGNVTLSAFAPVGSDAGRSTGTIAFDGEVEHVDVQFIGTGTVEGTVLKAGSPVGFATVTLTSRNVLNRPLSIVTQTDGNGHFVANSFLVGEVSATATEGITQLAGSAAGAIAGNGAVLDLTISLEPSGSASGRVLRQNGSTPAAGMALELVDGSKRFGSTAADGTFSFSDLSLGTYQLNVTDPVGSGVATATAQLTAPGQNMSFGDIVLDEASPSVVSIDPANGAAFVPVSKAIVVTFSEPVDPATVASSTLIVGGAAGAVSGPWALDVARRVATFTAAAPFPDFSPFSVKVTTGVKDRVGKPLAQEVVTTFTTADSTPPVTLTISPVAGAQNIALDSVVRVAFSEAVDPTTFTGPAISLSRSGSSIAGRIDFILNNTVVVFTPNAPLVPNAIYQVAVRAATDIFGNAQTSGTTYSFNTLDTDAPVIQSLTAPQTTVVEGSTVTVTASMGTATDVSFVEFLLNGQVALTDHLAPFAFDIQATAALGSSFTVTARATDTSGNVGPDANLTIAVQPDAPPVATIVLPADGSSVGAGAKITVTVHATDDRAVAQISLQASGAVAVAGTVLTALSTSADATFFVDVPLNAAPGPITLKAAAVDSKGNGSANAIVNLTLADTAPPTVSIVSPAAGSKIDPGQTLGLVVSASDNGTIGSVTVQAVGAAAFSETRAVLPPQHSAQLTFQIPVSATASEGDSASITAFAEDTAGNRSAEFNRNYPIRGPSGTIGGVVYSANGSTPAPGFLVKLTGATASQVTSGAQGAFTFNEVPLGAYALEAFDLSGHRRAHADGVVVSANGDTVIRNLTLIGTGTAQGRVANPDGTAAANLSVIVQSSDSIGGGTFNGTTNAEGRYNISGVPVGTFTVAVTDAVHHFSGNGSGEIVQEGGETTVDVQLVATVDLPVTRFDANNFTFDLQTTGAIGSGTRNVFSGDSGANRGGSQLEIVAAGTATRFVGGSTATLEENGREIAITQQNVGGVDVTRKIFVPRKGYFARYLELLRNPGTSPITIDLRVSSNLTVGYGAKQLVRTSSGDDVLDAAGEPPDRWLVVDDGTDADPFLTNNMPALALTFDGPAAADRAATSSYSPSNVDRVSYEWHTITIGPQQTVGYLHFVTQQTSRAAAQASAERLVQLPPEALDGLSAEELGAIRNFAVPANGQSAVAPLPSLDGTVNGRVLAADQTTGVPSAAVRFRSGNVLVGRTFEVTSNGTGAFSIPAFFGDAGDSRPVPVDAFTLQATDPNTNAQSPLTAGSFPSGQTVATQDVIFTTTGVIHGIVKRTSGAIVSSGTVQISGPALPAPLSTAIGLDGSYRFTGLLPGTYNLLATVPHPLGTALVGIAAGTLAAGQDLAVDITIQATGELNGAVTRNGAAAPNVPLQLAAGGFLRTTNADALGGFTFTDVPEGDYLLSVSDAATDTAASAIVHVGDNQTTTRDLALTPRHFRLDVVKTGTGSGLVTSTPPGVSCGNDCSEVFTTGSVVRLTAVPSPGSQFIGWEGACGGTTTNTCIVTMDGDTIASARFDPTTEAQCLPQPSGLVSFWPADGDSIDIVGSNDGVLRNGTSFGTGQIKGAFSFDGNNDLIESTTPPLVTTRDTFTIEFWANPSATRAGVVIGNPGNGSQRYAIAPEARGSGAGVGVSVGTNGIAVFEHGDSYLPAVVVYDAAVIGWNHIAVVYQNKQPLLYVNGVLVGTGLQSPRTNVYPSKIFGDTYNHYGAYAGLLDEVAIYDRALSDAELAAIFSAGSTGKCKGTTFDVSREFSAVQNPAGVWRYGAAAGNGAFSPYAVHDAPNGLPRWHSAAGIADESGAPNVVRNSSGNIYQDVFGPWPAGQVALHPSGSALSIVRWTAPSPGTYQIAATFTGGDAATSDVHVSRNQESLFADNINGQGSVASFAGTLGLFEGDVIDFAVGPGGNGSSNDTVFFDATIATPNPTVKVIVAGTGSGHVSSSTGGIDCGSDCIELPEMDSVLTFTAAADPGSTFAGFSGGCISPSTTCTTTVTGRRLITATFRADGAPLDSDGDSLPDARELAIGTDPTKADTDGDGFSDGVEVTLASDPLNAASTPTAKIWTAADSARPTDWSAPGNWSPPGAPTEFDDAIVPVSAPIGPRLTSGAFVRNLFVAAGIDVDTAGLTLTVSGSINALGVVGAGTVQMTGDAAAIAGRMPNVTVTGHVHASNAITVTGNLTVSGTQGFVAGGDFDVNGQNVTVAGNFVVPYPFYATLTMRDPSGLLKVDHNVEFDGNTEEGLLTAGELQVGGNWFTGGSASLNFVAIGSFNVVFNGTQQQTINFCCGTGPTSRRFANLVLANPSGVNLLTTAQVSGALTLTAGTVLTGNGFMTIVGDVTTAAGSDITVAAMSVGGALSASGHFSPGTTTFTGTNQIMPGGLAYQHVSVTGHLKLGGTATVTGNFTITGTQGFVAGGDFDLNGQTMTVTGNLLIPYPFYATLTMRDPAGLLKVLHDVTFDGNTEENLLTAGELQVGGNWFTGGSASLNFVAIGSFNVVFNGTQQQTINFCCGTGPTSRRFANLVLANPSGVNLLTTAQVNGALTLTAGTVLTGSGFMTIVGDVTTAAGSDITVAAMSVGGALSASGHFSPGTTYFAGSNQTVPGGLAYQHVTVLGRVILGGTATVSGNLTIMGVQTFVAGGDFNLNGQTLTITGNLLLPYPFYATLTMQDPAGLLKVFGDVTFDGNSVDGLLTAGELQVAGNWFVGGSTALNFVAAGTLRVVFNGTQTQTMNFCCGTGPTNRRFADLMVANPSGVNVVSTAQANGSLALTAGAVLAGNGFLTVAGDLVTGAGSNVTVAALSIGGALNVSGQFSPGTTYFTGANQTMPGGLAYQHVQVLGHVTLAGAATVTGNLTIAGVQAFVVGGDFNLNGQTLTVTGNLLLPYPFFATLTMKDPAGLLKVLHDVTFDGYTEDNLLTAGELQVGGNWFVGGSAALNFVAGGTFRVVFNGTLPQALNFCCGVGPNSRRFQDLHLANANGVLLQSDVYVAGHLIAVGTAQASPLLSGSGRTLSAAGADVNGLIVDNTVLILNDGDIVRFDNVVFRDYAPTATPVTLNRTQLLNATFTGLQFLSLPTSGRYIVGNDLDGPATASTLTIANAVPSNGSAKTATTGGFVINWGSAGDDTDGDGVTDADELSKYGTDPNNPDTDGDGATDGFEVSNNWNPLIAELCVPPLPGLVGWWKGDDNGLDSQGGNAMTLVNGVTFVAGVVSQAFSFDGVDDYGQAGDGQLPLGAAPRTLQFWTKPAFNARVPVIYGGFASSNAFYVLVEGSTACIGNWGGGPTQVCGSRTVVDQRWHHVAMTYDGSVARLYVDGVLDATVAKNYATTSTGKIYFGSTVEGSSEYFNGGLDEVRIYSRALTGAEVRDAYRSGHEATCLVPTYDPAMEYSLTSNPNGAWTFGASASLGSALVPFSTFIPGTVSAWRIAPGLTDALGAPAVAHNDSGDPASIYPAGRLGFHPGFNGEYAIIRWTVPAAGLYRVQVKFTGGDSTTTDVHVLQNGQALFAGDINGLGDTESFETIVSVNAGDTVDLAVGPNGNFFSDTTFVDLRITLSP